MRRFLFALVPGLLPLLLAAPVLAQQVVTTTEAAPVMLEPRNGAKPISTIAPGIMLTVIATGGEWLQVKLPRDQTGFERVGFVHRAKVRDAAPPAPVDPANMPVIAVHEFEYGAVKEAWANVQVNIAGSKQSQMIDVSNVGKGISGMLTEELLNMGTVRLVERSAISQVIQEQDLANSNRAATEAKDTAQLQKLVSARYLVLGSVTKFSGEQKNKGGILGAIGMRAIAGGVISLKSNKAYVNLTARVVDSSTGMIMGSATGTGESKRSGVLLGGLGAGGGGGAGGGINFGSSDFKDSLLGEASLVAVKDLARQLVAKLATMPK
jgi:curli biogenesis system outer membrane secretion channel CsgG